MERLVKEFIELAKTNTIARAKQLWCKIVPPSIEWDYAVDKTSIHITCPALKKRVGNKEIIIYFEVKCFPGVATVEFNRITTQCKINGIPQENWERHLKHFPNAEKLESMKKEALKYISEQMKDTFAALAWEQFTGKKCLKFTFNKRAKSYIFTYEEDGVKKVDIISQESFWEKSHKNALSTSKDFFIYFATKINYWMSGEQVLSLYLVKVFGGQLRLVPEFTDPEQVFKLPPVNNNWLVDVWRLLTNRRLAFMSSNSYNPL